jgi:hypothetical protein
MCKWCLPAREDRRIDLFVMLILEKVPPCARGPAWATVVIMTMVAGSPLRARPGDWTLLLSGSEVRIRDLDLAVKLGYARPRTIRELIARLIEEGRLSDVFRRRTVGHRKMSGKNADGTPRFVEVETDEYHLTREQALKVAARSETDVADALLAGARRAAAGERAGEAMVWRPPGRPPVGKLHRQSTDGATVLP